MAKMDDGTLRALVSAEIKAASGGDNKKLFQDRLRAIRYYRGEPYGNEMEGRSQVVSRDVAEAVDQTMPPLMEIFETTNEICRFEPRILYGMSAEDAQKRCSQAAQATEYVNAEWRRADQGYITSYSWFHDALRFRNGVIKVWWDDTPHITRERYTGLSDLSLEVLTSDPDIEIAEQESRPDGSPEAIMQGLAQMLQGGGLGGAPASPDGAPAPPGGAPAMPPSPPPMPMLHDVVVSRTNKLGSVKVAAVPLDEFLIQSRSAKIEHNPFTCHRYLQSVGELIERFPKLEKDIMDLPAGEENAERIERFADADSYDAAEGEEFDPARRRVWVCEAFVKADYDGDGIAEMRSVITAGLSDGADLILENEEVDDNPFCTLTPYPEPHAFWGGSVTEKVEDLQLIKSTLMRGALDTVYNSNAPRLAVDEGKVNLDDLLVIRPGGIVRIKGDPGNAMLPIPTLPVTRDAYEMIAMMDAVREQRTGIRRFAQGPGADALNNAYTDTATGAMLVDDSSKERVRFIARNFAETGFKRAMRLILKLESMHRKEPTVAKLGGQYVEIDPREWDTEMSMTVTVGLGTGSQEKLGKVMMALLQIDAQIIGLQQGLDGPLVRPEHVYAKLEKLIEYAGLKTAAPYYADPTAAPQGPPKPPKPDPEMMKAQAQMAIAQQKAQSDAQATQAKAQLDAQLAQQRAQLDAQLAQAKLQADMAAQRDKAALDIELDRRRAEHEMQVETMRAQHQAQLDQMRAQNEAADDARNAARQGQIETVKAAAEIARADRVAEASGDG